MNNPTEGKQTAMPHNPVIHYALQLLALALLMVWCFRILESFVTPLVWGGVLAITLYPLHRMLSNKLKGRPVWSATIITILFIALIIGPAVALLLATVDEFKILATSYKAGELHIPPPAEQVKEWPLIGAQAYDYWTQASTNLTTLITEHREEVKNILLKFLDLMASTSKGILLFALSIIISGVMLAYSKTAGDFAKGLLIKLAGKAGESMAESTELTVRNVAKGILGVAVIQSILAGIGFVLAGIPFAGIWIVICMILSIIQIGILPVSIGTIIYLWSESDTLTATIFTVWMIIVGISDNILKPILLGQGAPAPMLVVFLGAIGGFIASGFIGLFTGAILLTLGYKLLTGWLNNTNELLDQKN